MRPSKRHHAEHKRLLRLLDALANGEAEFEILLEHDLTYSEGEFYPWTPELLEVIR